jgi:hypothetical protein
MRSLIALLSSLLASSSLAATAAPSSEGRLTYVSRQLERATDPRLRAQAALLLAASRDPGALKPLCNGLTDQDPVVRVAVAKALGQLGDPGGVECIKPRLTEETGDVKAALQKSLEALEALASASTTKKPALYISIGPIADKTATLGDDLVKLAEDRLRNKLVAMGGVFAPAKETKAAAKSVIKAKQLKGFYLRVELDRTNTGGLRLNLICFTYPDRSLLGEVNVKASGGQPADLIRALAPKAVEEAAETFDWSS